MLGEPPSSWVAKDVPQVEVGYMLKDHSATSPMTKSRSRALPCASCSRIPAVRTLLMLGLQYAILLFKAEVAPSRQNLPVQCLNYSSSPSLSNREPSSTRIAVWISRASRPRSLALCSRVADTKHLPGFHQKTGYRRRPTLLMIKAHPSIMSDDARMVGRYLHDSVITSLWTAAFSPVAPALIIVSR